jgi:hypothetical protein
MNYSEEDLDKALDKLLIERGEHPTRVRNPLYGEERDLAKRLLKLFVIPHDECNKKLDVTSVSHSDLTFYGKKNNRFNKRRIV